MIKYIYPFFILIFLCGCSSLLGETPEESPLEEPPAATVSAEGKTSAGNQILTAVETQPPSQTIGDNLTVSRALAAKMAVLALNDKTAVSSTDREIAYTDTDPSLWYDKYINAATLQGIILKTPDIFRPAEALTISEAQEIINAINPSNPVRIKITEENKDKAISYALWCQLYMQCLEDLTGGDFDSLGIEEKSIIPLADSSNNSALPEGNIISAYGPYTADGISFAEFIDTEISVIEKDGEILALLSVQNTAPKIRGAYIVKATDTAVTIFSGGAERTYVGTSAFSGMEGKICDFTLVEGNATSPVIYTETISDTIKLINDDILELENYGKLDLSENFTVFAEDSQGVKWKKDKNLIVGTDIAEFFANDGIVHSAVIKKSPSTENIRVVIRDSNFDKLTHEEAVISSDKEFSVTSQGVSKIYSPGEKIYFNNETDLAERVYISSEGKLKIESLSRSYGTPSYRGILEISSNSEGFIIVNEVNMEEYLYSVVPSEMPTSYGSEALKVQAVTARSYAYNQFFANTFHKYGGNVCDSVISQVYNNIEENSASIEAVQSTKGICLTYGGSVISANFFSTSAGVTANNGEVWANSVTKEFPTKTSAYLSSTAQYSGGDYGDLSVEENMAAFIKNTAVSAYDSHSSWFRWNTQMTAEEIAASVNANLKARYEAAPKLVKTLQADGIFRSRPIETIGSLVNIEVVERGEGGNILSMKITGTEATVLVSTEYNIRTLLKPVQYTDGGPIKITLNNGSYVENYSLMPSAFFAMERMTDGEGNIVYVKFYGGGNGHGAGMSQTGVLGMVKEGFSFEEILEHYYKGTQVKQMW